MTFTRIALALFIGTTLLVAACKADPQANDTASAPSDETTTELSPSESDAPSDAPAPDAQPDSDAKTQADSDVSDDDVERFVNALGKIQDIQEDSYQQAVAAVEAEGLSEEAFTRILAAQQNPMAEGSTDISDDEIQKLERASGQINSIQEQAQQDIQSAIEAEGFALEEFDQVQATIQQDPTLMQDVITRLEEDRS
jgi:hypothetical protein